MMAFLTVMGFTLLAQASLNALAVLFHSESSLLLVAPIVLVVVVFCLDMLPGLWILVFAGMLIDSLTGSLSGVNMILLTFLGLIGMALSSWLGKPHWPMILAFLLGTSLVYRLIMIFAGNWGMLNLLLGPWADACMGLLIFYWLPKRVIKID